MRGDYILIEKGKSLAESENAIILLHGRGGSAGDIITLADEFVDDTFYICAPQATNNAWYPYSFLGPEDRNEPWLTSAVDRIKRLIEEISVMIPVNRIFLMGFSQGACLSLEISARFATNYGGIAAFSGGLIGETISPQKYNGDFKGTKIFIGCSDKDPHIPLSRVEESKAVLKKLGADITLEIYPGQAHTITQKEIDTVKDMMF